VEAALRGCTEVVDAAVVARRGGEDFTALVAYVVPRSSTIIRLQATMVAEGATFVVPKEGTTLIQMP
jgi:hypothetical protein